jgi:hypothetical protein
LFLLCVVSLNHKKEGTLVLKKKKKMSWSRVLKSAQALAAHTFLLCFTLLLLLKLDHQISSSWWLVFSNFFILLQLGVPQFGLKFWILWSFLSSIFYFFVNC